MHDNSPKYLEQQQVRGCTRQLATTQTEMAPATALLGDLSDASITGGTHTTSVRTLAFMHGLGFHRRRAAAAAAAAAGVPARATASASPTAPAATEEPGEQPDAALESVAQGNADESAPKGKNSSSSDDEDKQQRATLSMPRPMTVDKSTMTAADPLHPDIDVSSLGWEPLHDGELDSLAFLDQVDMQRAKEKDRKIVWADHSDDSSALLATVHPYALDSEFSLHRKVRSRAEKRQEKKAKEEARREKRKQRRTDKIANKTSGDSLEGDNTQRNVAKHRRTRTKGSRSDNVNHRLHDDDVSSMSSGSTPMAADDDGSCGLPNRCPCVLTGPTGETVCLVADGEGKGSYEIGRKTTPVGIGTYCIHICNPSPSALSASLRSCARMCQSYEFCALHGLT